MERHREGAWAFFRLTDRGAALRILRPTARQPRPVRSAAAGGPDPARGRARPALPGGAGLLLASRSGMGPHPVPSRAGDRGRGRRARRAWARGRSATSSISAPAPAACCSCWRPARLADGRARCQPCHAVGGPRQPGKGGPERHRAAAGGHLCASVPAQHLRSRRHPSGPALPRRSGPGDPRGGAPRGSGRAHPGGGFRASQPRVPARGAGASPPRLRAGAGCRLARRGGARLHAHPRDRSARRRATSN